MTENSVKFNLEWNAVSDPERSDYEAVYTDRDFNGWGR